MADAIDEAVTAVLEARRSWPRVARETQARKTDDVLRGTVSLFSDCERRFLAARCVTRFSQCNVLVWESHSRL